MRHDTQRGILPRGVGSTPGQLVLQNTRDRDLRLSTKMQAGTSHGRDVCVFPGHGCPSG